MGLNLEMSDSFHSTVCKTSDSNLVTFLEFPLPSLLKEKIYINNGQPIRVNYPTDHCRLPLSL